MVGGLRGHDGLGVEPQPGGPGVHCHHHQCSIDPSWNDVGGRGGIRPPGEEVGRPPCLVARVARVARELPRPPRTFLEPAAQPENLISHLDFKVQAGVCPINIEYLYKATRTSLNKPPRLKASQMTKPSPTYRYPKYFVKQLRVFLLSQKHCCTPSSNSNPPPRKEPS